MKRGIALAVGFAMLLGGCTATTEPQTPTTTTCVDVVTTTETEVTTMTQETDRTEATTVERTEAGNRVTTVRTFRTIKTTEASSPVAAVQLLEPANDFKVESQSAFVEEYLAITDEKKAAEFWVASYTGSAHAASFTARWSSKGALWRVYVSEDPTFQDTNGMLTTNSWYRVTNLMPGKTYYWKVAMGSGEESEVRRVTVEDTTVRWIEADGSDNVRDLGGWKTESGKTVNYGLLYRGACIDGYKGGPLLSDEGKNTFKKQLGIRTELDLRGSDAAMSTSPFGGKYFDVPMTQYDYIFTSSETKKSLDKIFEVLSKKANYPVYYHCNAGADRTGTLSFIISGLLGVSYDDLTRDFELTGFSSRGQRLRGKLNITAEGASFSEDGVMQYSGSNHIAWGPMYQIMMRDYGTGSGKLSDAIENFLKTECGVTQAEIDAVRTIMLE